MSEKLSSLLDGELSIDEFGSKRMTIDDEGLRTVERYQLIGAVLRKDCGESAVRLLREDFASRIGEKLDEEPNWMLTGTRRRASRTRAAGTARPAFFGGFAAAAAIAALAVFVVAPDRLGVPERLDAPLAATSKDASAADMDELNALLVEHGEFTGSAGLNGLVSYAKFVSHGQ